MVEKKRSRRRKIRAPVRVDFAGGTTDIYPFTKTHGGAVLNCGIKRYVSGKIVKTNESVHLEYTGMTPTSSGLGTSGVMNLVWLALISRVQPDANGFSDKVKMELAEKVYGLEQSMGLVGGKQDQYAAAFGGINFIEFKGDKVKLERLKLKPEFIRELERHLVLVYSGKPHFSGDSNGRMIERLKQGKNTKDLVALKDIAYKMKNALKKEDLDSFRDLMNEETKHRRKLAEVIIGPHLDRVIEKGFHNGAIAAKVCGSGGGGSVLFFTNSRSKLMKAFSGNIIGFKIDNMGLCMTGR
jgi:D-glycero-alpha-D-manno-heptose-7-phosphate kinase